MNKVPDKTRTLSDGEWQIFKDNGLIYNFIISRGSEKITIFISKKKNYLVMESITGGTKKYLREKMDVKIRTSLLQKEISSECMLGIMNEDRQLATMIADADRQFTYEELFEWIRGQIKKAPTTKKVIYWFNISFLLSQYFITGNKRIFNSK